MPHEFSVTSGSAPVSGHGLKHTLLRCVWCGETRAADLSGTCRRCGGTLRADVCGDFSIPDDARSLWDFSSVLPVGEKPVMLGEGGTPLLKLDNLYPNDSVFVKADWMNPTGSFKDRGASVAVSVALSLGAEGIICASTGNNGAAVSAYAARARLPCIVVLPEATPLGKVAQARACGATVAKVPGTFSDAYRFAERLATATPGWANLTSTYINPYMTAAHASITYELWGQLRENPGSILMPIGAGPMLDGIMAGAERLLNAGLIPSLPVPVGVQAAGCAPIAAAFADGSSEAEAWNRPNATIAGSISDPLDGYPADGTRTLRIVRDTGGACVAVSEEQIISAMSDLACHEGISAEPAAVTPLAALRLLDGDMPGFLRRPVVLVVSGHVLKDPQALPVDRSVLVAADGNTDLKKLVDLASRHFGEDRRG